MKHGSYEAAMAFGLSLPGALADRPFEDDLETVVLRHGQGGKWFGIFLRVSGRRVGLEDHGAIDILNLKIDPEEAFAVREMFEGIVPAYHMNKRHWISILLNGSVPDELTALLIEKSFDLTRKRMKKAPKQNDIQ